MHYLLHPIRLFLNTLAVHRTLRRLPSRPIQAFSNRDGRCLATFDTPGAVLAAGYPNVLGVIGTEHNLAYGVEWRYKTDDVAESPKLEQANDQLPISLFLSECCDLGKHHRAIKKQVYRAYCRWAGDNGYDALPMNQFGRQFLAASHGLIEARGQKQNDSGELNHCYQGVRLKPVATNGNRGEGELPELRPIEAIDLETGRTEWFPTIKAAENAGFHKYSILRVLVGEAKRHKGMSWRYWQEPSEPETGPESPEIATSILTEAMRRDELRRLTQSIYFDEPKNQWAIRLPGRTLYRATRPEAVSVWYENQHGNQAQESLPPPKPTPSSTLNERLASDLMHKLIDLSTNKWQGTGKALAAALKLQTTDDIETRELVAEVRALRSALEENGILVKFSKSNGQKVITIRKARVLSPAPRHPSSETSVLCSKTHADRTPAPTAARPVEAIDIKTGEVTAFDSLWDAERAGYRRHSICDVLYRRREAYAGKVWRDKSSRANSVVQNANRKKAVQKRITATKEARIARLLNKITKLPKPWGPGTATDLAAALGEWYGPAVSPLAPACSLGHILPQITRRLAAIGTRVEISMDSRQKRTTYTVVAATDPSVSQECAETLSDYRIGNR